MSFGTPTESGGLQPNREELLQLGIKAAKAGNKEGARVTFQQILSQDKKNERAMMWMAKLADTKADRKKWLNRVLAVNPDNDQAKAALQKMAYNRSASENRTLLIFGVVAGVMIVLVLVVVVALLILPKG
jgi:thioredoxin-like negative regulator of GroEL